MKYFRNIPKKILKTDNSVLLKMKIFLFGKILNAITMLG